MCLGCGRDLGFLEDTGPLAYTCPCGATIFYEPPLHFQAGTLCIREGQKILIPVSLPRSIAEMRSLPHIDYYLGKSAHTNEDKERFIEILRGLGACWSWQCAECRPRFIERTRMEVKERLYPLPLHSELKKIIDAHSTGVV